jgi:predicted AlkP superfamily phosphohydrolase/phosphomutase
MTAKLVVIGIDAAEACLLEQWTADGSLRNFARIESAGRKYSLRNPMRTLPGAIWPEITSGKSAGKLPLYFHPRQLHTGEARRRPVAPDELNTEQFYWTVAGRSGCRVAVIDQVQTVLAPSFNGIQVVEWGLHDPTYGFATDPPSLAHEIRRRYGTHPGHPTRSCDAHGGTRDGYEQLLHGLLKGTAKKSDLLVDLIKRESWDLFTCTFGEAHCAGHQLWHFHDPASTSHDPDAPAHLKTGLRSVYEQIDKGIGALLSATSPDTTILIFTSHGMGPYIGGPQMLPEVLARLGFTSGGDSAFARCMRRTKAKALHMPKQLHPLLRPLLEVWPLKRIQEATGSLLDPLESPRTRAASLINNRCGAIRLNLKGREPFGSVEPGPEAEQLVALLRQELRALKDPRTDQPIVDEVATATEVFGSNHHEDVPDIMVVFRTDLGPLEQCVSDSVGLVRVAINYPGYPRTGDHTTESRLWILGPRVRPGISSNQGDVLDIAPTVLSLLNVPLPDWFEGRPLSLSS